MRIGLISDIHGSHDSLLRALALLEKHNVSRVLCMGDIVHNEQDSDAVPYTLNDPWIACVRGNHDEGAVLHARENVATPSGDTLSPQSIAWLDELPDERRYNFERVRITIAHAAPAGLGCYVWPDELPRPLKRVLRTIDADVVILGHTHVPMLVRHHNVWLVNPGSVRGTRTRDSHTCGVLELPNIELTILSLDDGQPTDYYKA